jgi:hypothetical protein
MAKYIRIHHYHLLPSVRAFGKRPKHAIWARMLGKVVFDALYILDTQISRKGDIHEWGFVAYKKFSSRIGERTE